MKLCPSFSSGLHACLSCTALDGSPAAGSAGCKCAHQPFWDRRLKGGQHIRQITAVVTAVTATAVSPMHHTRATRRHGHTTMAGPRATGRRPATQQPLSESLSHRAQSTVHSVPLLGARIRSGPWPCFLLMRCSCVAHAPWSLTHPPAARPGRGGVGRSAGHQRPLWRHLSWANQ
jgi:hypothetical protein